MHCGKPVDDRCKSCGDPADENFFLRIDRPRSSECGLWMTPSRSASLDRRAWLRRINAALSPHTRTTKHVIVHRFEETIGGRAYQIDVTHVGTRWRAQLRREPGLPTAMMPFYGQTPDAAADQLTQWLEKAHHARREPAPVPRLTTV